MQKTQRTQAEEALMNTILSVYFNDAFKEYLLPSMNNADYTVILPKDLFRLTEDYHLELEILNHEWRIRNKIWQREPGKQPEKQPGRQSGKQPGVLKDHDVIRLHVEQKILSVIVRTSATVIHPYEKYCLDGVEALTVGKSAENDICYDYQCLVSRKHAVIRREGAGYRIINQSKNGVYVGSRRIEGTQLLEFGDFINIMGLHLLFLGNILAVDEQGSGARVNPVHMNKYREAEIVDNREQIPHSCGKTVYHRAPRRFQRIPGETVELEEPPQLRIGKKPPLFLTIGPALTMVLPMLLGYLIMYAQTDETGSSMYWYSGLAMSVSAAVIGAGWALINVQYQRKEEAGEAGQITEAYTEYLLEKERQIRQGYMEAEEMLRQMYPHVQECLDCGAQGYRLWNRNATHEDFLVHRVGLGEIPYRAQIQIPKERFIFCKNELYQKLCDMKEKYRCLHQVPVTLDLRRHHLIGLVGGKEKQGAVEIVRSLSAQAAANNCYTDVKMGFLYDSGVPGSSGRWAYARWLPHVWAEDKKTRYIAGSPEERREVCYELSAVFRRRMEEAQKDGQGKTEKPWYLLFIEDPKILEGEILDRYVFSKENVCGLTVILLAERYEDLPNPCSFIIENTPEYQGMYEVSEENRQTICFDSAETGRLDRFARHLSTLQVPEAEQGRELPEMLTFFEMFDVSEPQELLAEERWAKNRICDSIRGMLGQKAGGIPCWLDVHEKYHGPHGLIAGTTGSGKSETLQTWLLSLAVNYSPDDLAFFIIDYKGGGMANLFSGLPHLAGQISNLSGNQIKRAMISIKSENRRRQKILAGYGVNHINLYTKLYKNGGASEPMPHLFLIIDEFAELKREEPDFMRELISVAQVGRSLGVHLILATQKPGGTVDDNIWSNARFRLCLRVQDRQDSIDMLHRPDAAVITQTGRGYLQVGNDEVFEEFQSGYSGAAYEEGKGSDSSGSSRLLQLSGKVDITAGTGKKRSRREPPGRECREITQLEAVKEYLAAVAENRGYSYRMRLWMPVLRTCLYLEEFREYRESVSSGGGWNEETGTYTLHFVLGQMDDPENQVQLTLMPDLMETGHVAVCGNAGSGKSTLLQTMLYALLRKYSPERLQVYAIDFGSGRMTAFEDAPHMGGVVREGNPERTDRFFHMLREIQKERRQILGGGNYRQYLQLQEGKLPALLLMIDDYAAFREKTGERYEDDLIRLAREGESLGIYLALSGNGVGIHDILPRIFEHAGMVLCLMQQDPYTYSELLHRYRIDILPEGGIPGRGLTKWKEQVLEFQTALAVPAENDYQRMALIGSECRKMRKRWKGKCARRIPEIPEKPVWAAFRLQERFPEMAGDPSVLPIGYRAPDAEIYGIKLRDTYCYGIYGSARSGKTNLLNVCIRSALEKKSRVCVIDCPKQQMKGYEEDEKISYVSDENGTFAFFQELLPVFRERNEKKNQLIASGWDEDGIFRSMSQETPWFIFLTDLCRFMQMVYDVPVHDIRGFLENILEKGSLHHVYFIGVIGVEDMGSVAGLPAFESFTGYRTGIHLGGCVVDNPVLDFDDMTYADREKKEKTGTGRVPASQTVEHSERIVIPFAR